MSTYRVAIMGMIAVAGCATAAATGPLVPQIPGGIAGCRVGASQTSVLVTEWSGAEKANLEAMMIGGGGAIAVTFTGCEMRLLPSCKLAGGYYWQRTSVASDHIEIKNEAELAGLKEQGEDAKTLCGFCIAAVYNRFSFDHNNEQSSLIVCPEEIVRSRFANSPSKAPSQTC